MVPTCAPVSLTATAVGVACARPTRGCGHRGRAVAALPPKGNAYTPLAPWRTSSPFSTAASFLPSVADLRPRGGAARRSFVAAAAADEPSMAESIDVELVYTIGEERFAGLKAFVAGASGRTGREIVKALAAKGVKVRAMVRDPKAAAKTLPGLDEGVEVVKGDVFKYQTLPGAIGNCNVILCATGSSSFGDPLGPFSVDYQGTMNLVAAGKQAGVKQIIYVSSIGADDILFPLNLAWGVLFWKKRAEEQIQRSGIRYTIVRPGGLQDTPRSGSKAGEIVMKGADAFGLPPREQPGSILRSQVAECCVGALALDEAANKVVEVIAKEDSPKTSLSQLYGAVP